MASGFNNLQLFKNSGEGLTQLSIIDIGTWSVNTYTDTLTIGFHFLFEVKLG